MSGSKRGEKNPYHCPDCHGYIVTVHVDDGVTPMFLACRVGGEVDRDRCRGMMRSMMYPEQPWPERDGFGTEIPTVPTWEWYKPEGTELKALRRTAPSTYEHVRKGGLLLRPMA